MTIRYLTRAAIAFGAMAAFSGAAFAQIANSAHNLASGNPASGDRNEICVYCHTPHGARDNFPAPLWNKPDSGATYTQYDSNFSTTIDGAVAAVGSVSAACLTCHDGTQAMDVVLNAPGSGVGTPTNGVIDLGTQGIIPNTVARLGTDLTNDHPIGIQYGGFDPGTGQIDPDFVNSTNGLQTGNISGAQRWWVDTPGGTNERDKSDMILYTRNDFGVDQPFVECATCHDPHDTSNGTFLRTSNDNSEICLACHVK